MPDHSNLTTVRALIFEGKELVEVRYFNLPAYGEQKFYVTHVSYNAFKKLEGKRTLTFYTRLRDGKKVDMKMRRASLVILAEYNQCVPPEFRTLEEDTFKPLEKSPDASLWDFYKAINYDYVSQRYYVPSTQEGVTQNAT